METEVSKPEVHAVPVWRCKASECKAWIRDELASTTSPECPLCQGKMIRGMKYLPKLVKKIPPKKKEKQEDRWV